MTDNIYRVNYTMPDGSEVSRITPQPQIFFANPDCTVTKVTLIVDKSEPKVEYWGYYAILGAVSYEGANFTTQQFAVGAMEDSLKKAIPDFSWVGPLDGYKAPGTLKLILTERGILS